MCVSEEKKGREGRGEERKGTNGILVDSTRDQAGNVCLVAEDLREGVGEGRSGLDGGEVRLSDVVAGKEEKERIENERESDQTRRKLSREKREL